MRIAREIEKARSIKKIVTSADLRGVINKVVPGMQRVKTYARIFQALRIAVNNELEHLIQGLHAGFSLLMRGGRLVVLSYHSLEDRIVKNFFLEKARSCTCPPEFPVCICGKKSEMIICTRKAVRPSVDEIEANPRSRSARLRAGERL